ncbi:MAG TPA: methyltransferase domain-containing protein [Gemmatimonadaceae bacterium]|nr:methyltransferase domain-containing protein [Gemmatimonadaceae bacterium]
MSDRERWEARHLAAGDASPGEPSPWVMSRALALGSGGVALDLASGRGRHAVPLAAAGVRVVAVDISEHAVRVARRASLGAVHGVVADAGALPLRAGAFDVVLCVRFLDRVLLPRLPHLLRPGGALVCEIFTDAQRTLGRGPSDPAHLLRAGELPALVHPLRIVEYHEGLARDLSVQDYVARIVAVNDGGRLGATEQTSTHVSC